MRWLPATLLVCAPTISAAQIPHAVVPRSVVDDLSWQPGPIASFVEPPTPEGPELLGRDDPPVRDAVRAAEAALDMAPLDRPSVPPWARLLRAVSLAEQGRFEEAAAAYQSFTRACADPDSEDATSGSHCIAAQETAALFLVGQRAPPPFENSAAAHLALARRELALGHHARALAHLRAIDRASTHDAPTRAPAERCAIAEARFLLADDIGRGVLRESLPSFPGPSSISVADDETLGRFSRWGRRVLGPSVPRLLADLVRASVAYRRAMECVPVAIASFRAMGDLHIHILQEFRRLPEVQPDEDSGYFYDAREEWAFPFARFAHENYEFCRRLAIAHRWPTDDAVRCEQALSENFGVEYPPPFELVPSVAWSIREVAPAPRGLDQPMRADAIASPPLPNLSRHARSTRAFRVPPSS